MNLMYGLQITVCQEIFAAQKFAASFIFGGHKFSWIKNFVISGWRLRNNKSSLVYQALAFPNERNCVLTCYSYRYS